MTNAAKTVLVIDDDIMMGELIAAITESADYTTVVANSGNEGLQLAETATPALVLCDLSMPGMGGDEVLRRLRGNPRTSGIPFVLMTGHAQTDLKGVAADAFLQKPFCLDEVLPLISNVLQQQHACSAAA